MAEEWSDPHGTYVLCSFYPLGVREDTRANHNSDSETLGPHTGLHNLLRICLMPT